MKRHRRRGCPRWIVCVVEVAVEHPRSRRTLHGPNRWLILDGDAEQLADHGDRQRVAERRDEVERPDGSDGVEHAVAARSATCGAQLLHRARRERLAHQLPQPRVVGRVEDQQRRGRPLRRTRSNVGTDVGLHHGGARDCSTTSGSRSTCSQSAQRVSTTLVPLGERLDRRLGAHPVVVRVRVARHELRRHRASGRRRPRQPSILHAHRPSMRRHGAERLPLGTRLRDLRTVRQLPCPP